MKNEESDVGKENFSQEEIEALNKTFEKDIISTVSVASVILKTVNEAKKYREHPDAYEKTAQTFPKETGHNDSNSLEGGNLGALYFKDSEGNGFGENWIAPSRQMRSKVRKKAAAENKILLHYCKDNTIAICENENVRTIPITMTPSHDHANDSECVLLNALRAHLELKNIEAGELWLMTERIPCASCTNIIAMFLISFPDIRVNVIHLIDYVNSTSMRSHSEFQDDLTAQNLSVRLFHFDHLGNESSKITYLPPGTKSNPYSSKHIHPGSSRFAGIGKDGKALVTSWKNTDAHELRTSLLIKPSNS